jgi:hypothetical protein
MSLNNIIIANIFNKIDICKNKLNKCTIKNVLVNLLNLLKESKYNIHNFSNYILFYCKINSCCLCSLKVWNDIVYESNKYRMDLIKNNYIYCRCNLEKPHYYNINRQCCQLLTPVTIYTSINYLYTPHEYINDYSNVVETFIGSRKYANRYRICYNNEEFELLNDEDFPIAPDDLVINSLNILIDIDKIFYLVDNYYINQSDIELYNVSYNWDMKMDDLELYEAACHKILINNTVFKITQRRLSMQLNNKIKCVKSPVSL